MSEFLEVQWCICVYKIGHQKNGLFPRNEFLYIFYQNYTLSTSLTGPLLGEQLVTGGFPSQGAGNMDNLSSYLFTEGAAEQSVELAVTRDKRHSAHVTPV